MMKSDDKMFGTAQCAMKLATFSASDRCTGGVFDGKLWFQNQTAHFNVFFVNLHVPFEIKPNYKWKFANIQKDQNRNCIIFNKSISINMVFNFGNLNSLKIKHNLS